jgi:hypothetical protein
LQIIWSIASLACYDRTLLHCLMLIENRFDLARFDAEAANLHLKISAHEQLDIAVPKVTRQITCCRVAETRSPAH